MSLSDKQRLSPGLRAVLLLNGAVGSGKTTIATLLGEALTPSNILFIDATADQKLTHSMAPVPPKLTLAQVFGEGDGQAVEIDSWENAGIASPEALEERNPRSLPPSGREAIDWAFNDLTVSVGEESDLLTVGALYYKLDSPEKEKLRYGLNRLMEAYDYVIIDGLHPLLLDLLPDEPLRVLDVLTPSRFSAWQPLRDEALLLHTPYVLLNFYDNQVLPEALEQALINQQCLLIGKLPTYPDPRDCAEKMPRDFESGLLRLNIPLFPV